MPVQAIQAATVSWLSPEPRDVRLELRDVAPMGSCIMPIWRLTKMQEVSLPVPSGGVDWL